MYSPSISAVAAYSRILLTRPTPLFPARHCLIRKILDFPVRRHVSVWTRWPWSRNMSHCRRPRLSMSQSRLPPRTGHPLARERGTTRGSTNKTRVSEALSEGRSRAVYRAHQRSSTRKTSRMLDPFDATGWMSLKATSTRKKSRASTPRARGHKGPGPKHDGHVSKHKRTHEKRQHTRKLFAYSRDVTIPTAFALVGFYALYLLRAWICLIFDLALHSVSLIYSQYFEYGHGPEGIRIMRVPTFQRCTPYRRKDWHSV